MMKKLLIPPMLGAALALLGGCSTNASAEPAVLTSFGPETQDRLKEIIGEELGRKNIMFGASDPTSEPVLVVLPPRPGSYETMSPAEPLVFDIKTGADGCYLVRQDDGTILVLTDISCMSAN